MKTSNLTIGFLAALLLTSPMAGAGGNYPPDFEPVILYQDADYIAKSKQVTTAAPAPAAPAVAEVSSSKYPPDFEPVILFQDADYIAKSGSAATSAVAAEEAETSATESPAAGGAKSDNPLTENLPIVGIALALAALAFWGSRRSGASVQAAPAAPAAVAEGVAGETGVARYLKSVGLPSGGKETGVARYLKSLPVSAVVSAAETGVARYLKNRG